jgi:hypothetical protein
MGKAINTHEDIIAAGEKLEAQSGGETVAAWQIYKALGEVGKFDRVKSIWEGHATARTATPTAVKGGDLPAELDGAIGAALETLGAAIRGQFANHIAALVSDHVRQMQLAHAQYSSDKAKQSAQIDFWSESAIGRLEQIEALESEIEALTAKVEVASAAKPAGKPPAKRKTTRASVKPVPGIDAAEAADEQLTPPAEGDDDQPSLGLD